MGFGAPPRTSLGDLIALPQTAYRVITKSLKVLESGYMLIKHDMLKFVARCKVDV